MKTKLGLSIVVLAALVAGGYYFLNGQSEKDSTSNVRLVTVKKGELIETAAASGKIEPNRQVEVKSRASGEVVEVSVKEGQVVEEGQLLFKLDPSEIERNVSKQRAALERLEAQLEQSQAGLTIARYQSTQARADASIDAEGSSLGVVSDAANRQSTTTSRVAAATVRQRQADIKSLEAQIRSAQLDVEVAELNLSYTEILAPFSGTILAVEIELGSMVASGITNVSGGTSAMILGDLSDLRVVGQIAEAQVSRVEVGQKVNIRVDAYPDRSFTGEVMVVSPMGKSVQDVVTFDVEARVTDADANLLRSGMSADVEIITDEIKDALMVPLTAIVSRGSQRFVRLPNDELQEVKTGPTDGSRIIIREGLAEGQEIQAIGARPRGAGAGARPGGAPRGGMMPMGGGRRR